MKAMVSDLSTLPAALTVEQAAAVLGISKNGAYDAIRRGEIASLKIGARLIVPKQAVMRMLQVVD